MAVLCMFLNDQCTADKRGDKPNNISGDWTNWLEKGRNKIQKK